MRHCFDNYNQRDNENGGDVTNPELVLEQNRETLDRSIRELHKSREAKEKASDLLSELAIASGLPVALLDDIPDDELDEFDCGQDIADDDF